jgi:hypothetical protein
VHAAAAAGSSSPRSHSAKPSRRNRSASPVRERKRDKRRSRSRSPRRRGVSPPPATASPELNGKQKRKLEESNAFAELVLYCERKGLHKDSLKGWSVRSQGGHSLQFFYVDNSGTEYRSKSEVRAVLEQERREQGSGSSSSDGGGETVR